MFNNNITILSLFFDIRRQTRNDEDVAAHEAWSSNSYFYPINFPLLSKNFHRLVLEQIEESYAGVPGLGVLKLGFTRTLRRESETNIVSPAKAT